MALQYTKMSKEGRPIVSIAQAKTIVAINDQTFFAVIMPGIKTDALDAR